MSNDNKDNPNNNSKAVAERKPTYTERFTNEVKRQFQGAVGRQMDLDEHQKQLMTNMFIKADSALEEHEARRQKNNSGGMPYTWENVDMQKLALDAMHRIRLGLDALIDNHIHPIPYINRKTGKYDLNLMIGFKGKLYYRKQVALHPVRDVRIELVHENDEFSVIKKSGRESIEDYEFKIKDPFNRGKVLGGFGYIIYEDESRNELVIVTKEDFDKSRNAAQSNKFWGPWEQRMQLKTLTHRVAEAIEIDPRKVNKSFHYVEAQDNPYADDMEVRIEQPTERQALDFNDASEISSPVDNGEKKTMKEQADRMTLQQKKKYVQSSFESDDWNDDPAIDFMVDQIKKEDPDYKCPWEKEHGSPRGSNPGKTADNDGTTDHEQLMSDVNALGKQVHGSGWYKESKVYVANYDEAAENLLDLGEDGLTHIKRVLESKAETQEA